METSVNLFRQTGILRLPLAPAIVSWATVGGKKEAMGPLSDTFDLLDESGKFGKETFEEAESEMQHLAMNLALKKKRWNSSSLDVLFAGDLLNQCTASAYGHLELDLPYFGLYGACSTSAEGLCLAAMLSSGNLYRRCGVVVSSHFASAERQFRYPLEYGSQRTPTSQWTVTGSAAFLLDRDGNGPRIPQVLPGRAISGGIKDLNNMGAAMAPAAADTLLRFFQESGDDFPPALPDIVLTGDLGREGNAILQDLLRFEGIDLGDRLQDGGLRIYGLQEQDVHAGGSGCGCGASVLAGEILPKLARGEIHHVLYLATGALMSPVSIQQGGSIPGIAHLVHLCADGEETAFLSKKGGDKG